MINWRFLNQNSPKRIHIRRTNKNTLCKLSLIKQFVRSSSYLAELLRYKQVLLKFVLSTCSTKRSRSSTCSSEEYVSSSKKKGNSNKNCEERNNVVWYLHQEINSFGFSIVLHRKCKKYLNTETVENSEENWSSSTTNCL